MKKPRRFLTILLALLAGLHHARAQGAAFTYQGQLMTASGPANGTYDLTFELFATSSGGAAGAGPVTNLATTVASGLFTATIDFGAGVITSGANWLQMAVRTNGRGAFTSLWPLQQLAPTPYAIYSETSGAANSVISNGISAVQLNTAGAPSNGQVLSFNGGSREWTTPTSGGSGWSLAGNAGTAGGLLGTTDNEPLEAIVNNLKAMELFPEANNSVSLAVGPGVGLLMGAQGVNVFGGFYGGFNTVYANYSTIAGGYNNTINAGAPAPFIAGGQGNVISGDTSAIGGGFFNTVNGSQGTIPGGADSLVSGSYGFAAGDNAQATNVGAFVWADASGGTFSSTTDNQFSVRAAGGVRLLTGGAGLTIDGQTINPTPATPSPIPSMQVFATPGTSQFVVPSGVTRLMIEVWGGGGGYGKGVYVVTPGTSYAVTVGAGGVSQTAGSTSSVGGLISATGGFPGTNSLCILNFYSGSGGGPARPPSTLPEPREFS